LPRQTAHRVLQQLEKTGLVTRDAVRDRFAVGPKLTQLALAALYSENQVVPFRESLVRLEEEVQETCQLGVLRGMEFLVIERVESKQPLRIQIEGPAAPAHCTAGGKVQLAHMPADVRTRLLHTSELKPTTPNSVTDTAQLESQLHDIKRQGYAICIEELVEGLSAIAVPILDQAGRPRAALTVHGPVMRLPESRMVGFASKMQQTARELAMLWELDEPR
jgi:IclR family transcriptional regulator, acetate operon repressor